MKNEKRIDRLIGNVLYAALITVALVWACYATVKLFF